MPEVHNPPSLFGGEFSPTGRLTMHGLKASEAANVRRLLIRRVAVEIETKECLFDGRRSIVDEDPDAADRRSNALALDEGREPRRNRAEDWTARHGLAEHFVGQLALLADVRELEEARYCELALVP